MNLRSTFLKEIASSLRRTPRNDTVLLLFTIILLIIPTRVNAQKAVGETEQLDFAQGLLAHGMYDMTILQCRKFIADYPNSASLQDAYLSLGEAYFLSQNFKEAVDTFNQFKQLYPHSEQLPVSLLRLAQMDIQQKKYDEALKELTSIDAQKQLKGPMLQSFDFYTAQAYMGKADTAAALGYFQKATQVRGASAYSAYAFKEIGKIDAQNGHYSESMDAYAKSMRLAGDDFLKGELTYRTAEVEFLSGKYADAIKGFRQVLDRYPGLGFTQDTLFAIHFMIALAFIELKEYDQANVLLDSMLAFPTLKSQEMAKIFVKKADILIREGKYKDGLALLDAYSSEDINDADETLFLKARGYYGLGDFERAFNFFENVCLNFPGSRFFSDALYDAAMTAVKNNQPRDAVNLLREYLAGPRVQRPNTAYFLLGYDQQLLGNSDQALKAYAQVDQHKENGAFYLAALKNMAIIYLGQEKDEQARAYFDRLISQSGQNDLQIKTYIWVCNEYLKEQEFDDVLRIAAQAEKHFPAQDLLEIKYFKAEALRGRDSCGEAVKSYELVTSSAQKNAYTGSAHIGHGLCLENAGKFDDAKKEFEKSLDENAGDSTVTMHATFEMANIEASQGHLDDALKLYLLVAAIYNDGYYCSESLLRAAGIYERTQRHADALKMYSEILNKYKNSAAAHYAKGAL